MACTAVGLLGRLGLDDPKVVAALEEHPIDGRAPGCVQHGSVWSLKAIGTPEAIAALERTMARIWIWLEEYDVDGDRQLLATVQRHLLELQHGQRRPSGD